MDLEIFRACSFGYVCVYNYFKMCPTLMCCAQSLNKGLTVFTVLFN